MNDQTNFPMQRSGNMAMTLVDPSAVAAAEAAKARIQAAYIMALQKPRSETDARDRILTACRRSEFAGRAEYSKPIGTKAVTGPSIRFAELALREWGNILTETQMLYEDDNVRRLRVSVLDLETNTQFTKDIQLKRTVERSSMKNRENDMLSERKNSYGKPTYLLRATDEEMYTKEAAWVSRVLRNEGLRVIPTDIIEEGMQVARDTVSKRAFSDPAAETKRILDAFSSIGVKPKHLEKYLRHGISTVSPHELVNLRTVYQSIRDGETSWADVMEFVSTDDHGNPSGDTSSKQPDAVQVNIKPFESMVSAQGGQAWKFVPNSPGALTQFIVLAAQSQDPPVSPDQIMAGIDEKAFPAFWQAFQRYAAGQKAAGAKPTADNTKNEPTPEPTATGQSGGPADTAPQSNTGGQGQTKPQSANQFDKIEQTDGGWQGNRMRRVGVKGFWKQFGDSQFVAASDAAQEAFRAKWIITHTENGSLLEPFPGDALLAAVQGPGQSEDQEWDDESGQGGLFGGESGMEDPPFGHSPDPGPQEPTIDDLKSKYEQLISSNPDLKGKFLQLWAEPKTAAEYEQAVTWISGMVARHQKV